MARVVLENLIKTYPGKNGSEVRAVNGISLTVEDREFMVLVGPSGCGKTTTLRMIAGLESVTSGSLLIDGQPMNDVVPKERDIAMVFQNYALYPHMTVFQNLAFGLKMRGVSKDRIEAGVREAAGILGLEPYLARKPAALSGGQRQRVALGRALVRKPKVFLFDEPLSNLDAKMRVSTRAEIARLRDRLGATMIYVTHDQAEAMTLGDRICVMKDGDIQQIAPPLELYNNPTNAFVAGFIGSPPMNLFKGAIGQSDGKRFFLEQEGQGSRLRIALDGVQIGQLGDGGRSLILGIRPEHIGDSPHPKAQAVKATVEIAEPMGSETLLHLNSGATPFVAKVAPTAHYHTGQEATVWLRTDLIQFFNAETGLAIRG